MTLLQRPQRRFVEPEQQEAGPGSWGEAEPELPTQKLLRSCHSREVEHKQNPSHRRGPPGLLSFCRARLAQPVAQVGPASSQDPTSDPPTVTTAPKVSQPRGRCFSSARSPGKHQQILLALAGTLLSFQKGLSQFLGERLRPASDSFTQNFQSCLSFPSQPEFSVAVCK